MRLTVNNEQSIGNPPRGCTEHYGLKHRQTIGATQRSEYSPARRLSAALHL